MKENRTERKSYVAAALQRKQAAAAASEGSGGGGVPRVAGLARPSSRLSQLSPLRGSISDRPLSSLTNGAPARPAPRVGCRPATHSTRLVPLADAAARVRARAAAPAVSAASHARGAPAVSNRSRAATPSVSVVTAIGDPVLDSEEAALQAELQALDLNLRASYRRSPTPVAAAAPLQPAAGAMLASPAASPTAVGTVVLGVPAPLAAVSPVPVSPMVAAAEAEPSAAGSQAPAPAQLSPQPEPQPAAQVPVPHTQEQEAALQDQSIVRTVVTATGTGCRDIVAAHTAAPLAHGACWTTRGHRVLHLESSCILQLWGRSIPDVTLRVTFADAASVPAVVRLEHAPTPTAAFERLGDIRLQRKSLTQLKHLFRLGKRLEVQRCLRITLIGHIAADSANAAHRVTHMLLTAGQGPQRTPSAMSSQHVDPLSARSAQASVNHSASAGLRASVDSGASGAVPHGPAVLSASVGASAAPVERYHSPAAATQQQPQQPSLGSGVEGTVWSQLSLDAPADVDFRALAEEFAPQAAAAAPSAAPAAAPAPEPAPASSRTVLPAERCAAVGAALAALGLSPAGAREAVLQVLEPERSVAAPPLREEQAEQLLQCLPSAEEQRALAAFEGPPVELSPAEQFMLQAASLPALEPCLQAWRLRGRFAPRAQAAEEAVTLLGAACGEVEGSEALRIVLKVALAAGNFLNAGNEGGTAAGFQIDALLKLKAVKSSRVRSRTLLHFVAREVARLLPAAASLAAELPSAGAAAQLDLPALMAELREMAAEARSVERALEGGSRFRALQAFRADVVDRLSALHHRVDAAEVAFRHLGSFINGQRSTLAAPAAFFGVLASFAAELDAAHDENAAADAAAEQAGSGRKPRRAGSQGSPAASAASGASRRRRSTAQESRRSTADSEAAASAASDRRQRSSHSVVSQAAVSGLGGSRRSEAAPDAGGSPPPAASTVDVASLLQAGTSQAASRGASRGGMAAPSQPAQAQEQPQSSRSVVSSPVASLLAESARLISSVDMGGPSAGASAFGSAIIPEAAGTSAASQSHGRSATRDTAATPDGAVQSASVGGAGAAACESDAYTTPRELQAGGLSQLRQRSMQHLSPTSTPLSSLGRQSSRSSAYSSDAGGSTPASARLFRGSQLRHSSSPLGLAASAASGDAAAIAAAAAGEAGTALRSHHHHHHEVGGHHHEATSPACAHCVASQQQQQQLAVAVQQLAHQAAAAAAAMYADTSDEEVESEEEEEARRMAAEEEAEVLAAARPARGFGALHSRAGSVDMDFYAPFTVDRLGAGALQQEQAQAHGMRASFAVSQGSGSAWGPLAAQQERMRASTGGGAGRPLRYASVDDLALPSARPASSGAGKRVSFSVPASPHRLGADADLSSMPGRPQAQQPADAAVVGWGAAGAAGRAARYQQLSPVLESLLGCVPTPAPAGPAGSQELAADDLADMAGCSSDHEGSAEEAQWAALERQEQQRARQQAAEREAREQQLQALEAARAALEAELRRQREPTPVWTSRNELEGWFAAADEVPRHSEADADQAAAAGEEKHWQHQQHQQQAAAGGQAAASGAALGPGDPLPSPLTSATSNFDVAVARLLASAGNTPTGPLGHHRRTASLGAAAGEALAQQVVLLEPVMPAPLGEGVRASHRMAEGVPPSALRRSVNLSRAMLRPGSTGGLPSSLSAPAARLSQEAAAWAAEQAAAAAARGEAGWGGAAGEQVLGDDWKLGEPERRPGGVLRDGLRNLLKGKQH